MQTNITQTKGERKEKKKGLKSWQLRADDIKNTELGADLTCI